MVNKTEFDRRKDRKSGNTAGFMTMLYSSKSEARTICDKIMLYRLRTRERKSHLRKEDNKNT